MEVKIRRNESSENLIKRFVRKSKKEKITEEWIERRYYKKPSVIKREKYFKRLLEIEKLKRKEKAEMEK